MSRSVFVNTGFAGIPAIALCLRICHVPTSRAVMHVQCQHDKSTEGAGFKCKQSKEQRTVITGTRIWPMHDAIPPLCGDLKPSPTEVGDQTLTLLVEVNAHTANELDSRDIFPSIFPYIFPWIFPETPLGSRHLLCSICIVDHTDYVTAQHSARVQPQSSESQDPVLPTDRTFTLICVQPSVIRLLREHCASGQAQSCKTLSLLDPRVTVLDHSGCAKLRFYVSVPSLALANGTFSEEELLLGCLDRNLLWRLRLADLQITISRR